MDVQSLGTMAEFRTTKKKNRTTINLKFKRNNHFGNPSKHYYHFHLYHHDHTQYHDHPFLKHNLHRYHHHHHHQYQQYQQYHHHEPSIPQCSTTYYIQLLQITSLRQAGKNFFPCPQSPHLQTKKRESGASYISMICFEWDLCCGHSATEAF